MKKKFFDTGLFFEKLNQLKVVGIIFTAILSLEAVLVPLGELVFTGKSFFVPYEESIANATAKNFMAMHPSLTLVYIVMAPLVTLMAFSFLNRRNTSDFWHSVPQTRTCVFLSFATAVFSWLVFAAVVSSAVSVGMYLLLHRFFVINWITVFKFLLSVVASAMLVEASVLIAMALTGTVLTNVVVSILLVIMPRVYIYVTAIPMFESSLTVFSKLSPFVTGNSNSLINIIFDALSNDFFFGEDMFGFRLEWSSVLYTVLLSVLYFAIAAFLFKIRKSEVAEKSAVNRIMQAIFRIVFASIFCLIPNVLITLLIYSEDFSGVFDDFSLIYIIAIFYILALIAYLLYELITTRKLKNVLKSLPALAILVAFNFTMIFGSLFMGSSVAFYSPEKEKVTSVKIESGTSNWFDAQTSEIAFTDSSLIEILCDDYNHTRAQVIKTHNKSHYYVEGADNSIAVGFKDKMGYTYRNVYMTDKDFDKVMNIIENDEKYKNIYDFDYIISNAISKGFSFADSAQQKVHIDLDKLINHYRTDSKTVDLSDWQTMMHFTHYYGEDYSIGERIEHLVGYIAVNTELNGRTYEIKMPVIPTMKNTYDYVMSQVFDETVKSNRQQTVIDTLRNGKVTIDGKEYRCDSAQFSYEQNNLFNCYGFYDTEKEEGMEGCVSFSDFADLLDSMKGTPYKRGARVVFVDAYLVSDDGWYEGRNFRAYFVADDLDFNELFGFKSYVYEDEPALEPEV